MCKGRRRAGTVGSPEKGPGPQGRYPRSAVDKEGQKGHGFLGLTPWMGALRTEGRPAPGPTLVRSRCRGLTGPDRSPRTLLLGA